MSCLLRSHICCGNRNRDRAPRARPRGRAARRPRILRALQVAHPAAAFRGRKEARGVLYT